MAAVVTAGPHMAMAKKDRRPRRVPVAGEEFESIRDAARAHGVNEVTFRGRIDRGWTPEQAAGVAPPPAPWWRSQQRKVWIKGRRFDGLRAAGRELGVSKTTAARWERRA